MSEMKHTPGKIETFDITSTNDIEIGMVFCYTGIPRGTGIYPPEVGTLEPIKTKSDAIGISIEIIERGRGWKPVVNGGLIFKLLTEIDSLKSTINELEEEEKEETE